MALKITLRAEAGGSYTKEKVALNEYEIMKDLKH
jgi:hypothetical protein